MKHIFITGANRGIGLEFVKQLLCASNPPKNIFATYRNEDSSNALLDLSQKHSSLHLMKFDVTKYDDIPKVTRYVQEIVGGEGLNVLINNSGIMKRSNLADVTVDEMLECYLVNAIAPLMLVKNFLPLIKLAASADSSQDMSVARAAVINITSKVGSIDDNGSGGKYPYRSSKAALNMINKNLSIELKESCILCVLLHPGSVKTDMGGPKALLEVKDSVSGMLSLMNKMDKDYNGKFYDFKGNEIPW